MVSFRDLNGPGSKGGLEVATEKDFETAIAKYPELIEEGLVLIGRQSFLEGKRMDLLFEDRLKNHLVVELKWGPIRYGDIGQVMSYAGYLVSGKPVREMLVGARVPPNLQAILDHHGIEWKQITASELCDFLRAKGDEQLAKIFDVAAEALGDESGYELGADVHVYDPKRSSARDGAAALFAPVEGRWLDAARDYFAGGEDLLFFFTDASIGQAAELDIHHVYFKRKGEPQVSARGDFVRVTTDHQPLNRLPGHAENHGRFYYGFRNLRTIDPIPLSALRFYNTDRALPNDVPGARIIKEPPAS
jgi:Endonuclease NucS